MIKGAKKMAKVESFELDHTKVQAPYVRLAGTEQNNDIWMEKYDLRFLQPNQDAMSTAAMHTIEHLLAVNLRDELNDIIDLSPMGCRTGFYLILWNQHSAREVRDALVKTLNKILEMETVPATTAKECGNYKDHSLFGAKEYVKMVLADGFSLDPFERVL